MSLINDILRGGTAQPATAGQQPKPPATNPIVPSLQSRFSGVFHRTFASSIATVFERGAQGAFDDPTIALAEQAALQRLRVAQRGASVAPAAGLQGANAAPARDAVIEPVTTSDHAPSEQEADVAIAEQRKIYALREQQSEVRLQNITRSLAQDFPKASQLAPASTGTWDPATFVPQSRDQAQAFAQRMVIDATESAARLEVVKTKLDSARFEAAVGGSPTAKAQVVALESEYDRQVAYVGKLVNIVDAQSGGNVSDAGDAALAGSSSMRSASDIPVDEIVTELRAQGIDEAQIRQVVGATELAVEQEVVPGGSPKLKQIATDLTRSLLAEFDRVRSEHRNERRRDEERRAQKRRILAQRANEKRIEELRVQHQRTKALYAQQAAQAQAEFQQWLAELSAARRQHRAS